MNCIARVGMGWAKLKPSLELEGFILKNWKMRLFLMLTDLKLNASIKSMCLAFWINSSFFIVCANVTFERMCAAFSVSLQNCTYLGEWPIVSTCSWWFKCATKSMKWWQLCLSLQILYNAFHCALIQITFFKTFRVWYLNFCYKKCLCLLQ